MSGYDLELDKVIGKIINENSKSVLIQLPDGLKPKAKIVADTIFEKTGAEVFIWFGSCFGACDFPHVREIDLLVSFGHSVWKY